MTASQKRITRQTLRIGAITRIGRCTAERSITLRGRELGSGVVIGGQAGIIGHIEIGDGTMIGAQSGVSKSLHGGTWWATPTVPLKEAKEQLAWVRRLGQLFGRVKALEEKLGKNP